VNEEEDLEEDIPKRKNRPRGRVGGEFNGMEWNGMEWNGRKQTSVFECVFVMCIVYAKSISMNI